MNVRETTMWPNRYLDSLVMGGPPWSAVYAIDGATLYKLTDDHFVIFQCTQHPGHTGVHMLIRLMPEAWEQFAEFVNPEAGFRARHYGPVVLTSAMA